MNCLSLIGMSVKQKSRSFQCYTPAAQPLGRSSQFEGTIVGASNKWILKESYPLEY